MLDRCLGWRGLCIEPNPHISLLLEAYRSCQVLPHCVATEASERPFAGRDGHVEFKAFCRPLGELLREAQLQRIDLLTVDVEHQELAVLQSLDLREFDIRVMVIEVTRGARWLEVPSMILFIQI